MSVSLAFERMLQLIHHSVVLTVLALAITGINIEILGCLHMHTHPFST